MNEKKTILTVKRVVLIQGICGLFWILWAICRDFIGINSPITFIANLVLLILMATGILPGRQKQKESA